MTGTENLSIKKTFTIGNKLGLHARAAAKFVQVANKFGSDIFVEKNDHKVNGKSIMGVMMLAAGYGSRIVVKANGPDAHEAMQALQALIDEKFGEE